MDGGAVEQARKLAFCPAAKHDQQRRTVVAGDMCSLRGGLPNSMSAMAFSSTGVSRLFTAVLLPERRKKGLRRVGMKNGR